VQTRNLLFSVVLCVGAQAGLAECDRQPQSAATSGPADVQKVAHADPAKSTGGPNKLGDMLIKNADAGQPHPRLQPVSLQPQPTEATSDTEERPRATTAMLLAALAVMFAIALRRGGAED
jgi:hypothetical protein